MVGIVVTVVGLLGLPAAAHAATITIAPAAASVSEGAGKVDFTVSRTALGTSASTAIVTLGGAGSTATCPADVTPCSKTVSLGALLAGSATASFTVVDDALDEPDETITAAVSSVGGADTVGSPATASTTITDNDDPPSIAIGNGSVVEGTGAAATTLALPLTLSASSGKAVSVGYDLAAGTAGADDVALTRGTVTIPAGQTTGTIPAQVVADAIDEDDETFTATLRDPGNLTLPAAVAARTATGTILDDDTASISLPDVTAAEGQSGTTPFTFTASLSTPASHAITVAYGTDDMGATAPSDYAATSGTLTFAPGVTAQSFVVPVVGDLVPEANEVFGAHLANPTGAVLGRAAALGGILNDDLATAAGSGGTSATGSGGLGSGAGSGSGGSGSAAGGSGSGTGPAGKLSRITLKKPRTLRSSLSCPATTARCKATVTVFTVAAPRGKVKGLRHELKLGSTTLSLAGGRSAAVSIRVTAEALKLLKQARHTTVRGYAVIRDPAGNVGTAQAAGRISP